MEALTLSDHFESQGRGIINSLKEVILQEKLQFLNVK